MFFDGKKKFNLYQKCFACHSVSNDLKPDIWTQIARNTMLILVKIKFLSSYQNIFSEE